MFQRVAVAKIGGTSKQEELFVTPSKLVQVFGEPTKEPWDGESLGAFYFQGSNGEIVILYHRASDVGAPKMPARRELFWAQTTTAELSVGAKQAATATEFKSWLASQLE